MLWHPRVDLAGQPNETRMLTVLAAFSMSDTKTLESRIAGLL